MFKRKQDRSYCSLFSFFVFIALYKKITRETEKCLVGPNDNVFFTKNSHAQKRNSASYRHSIGLTKLFSEQLSNSLESRVINQK